MFRLVFEWVYLYVLALSWATAHTKCMQLMSTRSLRVATELGLFMEDHCETEEKSIGTTVRSPKISLEASVLDGVLGEDRGWVPTGAHRHHSSLTHSS